MTGAGEKPSPSPASPKPSRASVPSGRNVCGPDIPAKVISGDMVGVVVACDDFSGSKPRLGRTYILDDNIKGSLDGRGSRSRSNAKLDRRAGVMRLIANGHVGAGINFKPPAGREGVVDGMFSVRVRYIVGDDLQSAVGYNAAIGGWPASLDWSKGENTALEAHVNIAGDEFFGQTNIHSHVDTRAQPSKSASKQFARTDLASGKWVTVTWIVKGDEIRILANGKPILRNGDNAEVWKSNRFGIVDPKGEYLYMQVDPDSAGERSPAKGYLEMEVTSVAMYALNNNNKASRNDAVSVTQLKLG